MVGYLWDQVSSLCSIMFCLGDLHSLRTVFNGVYCVHQGCTSSRDLSCGPLSPPGIPLSHLPLSFIDKLQRHEEVTPHSPIHSPTKLNGLL